jgi:GT2 family glycosyltransferase
MTTEQVTPQLSVVIVNYNTRTLLRACLQSLMKQPTPVEIIVVDNHSNDGSALMVADLFPQVTLLAQEKNQWFCGGNNIGIEAATCDTVLLLNPDTVVKPDALGIMLDFMAKHPDYAGCTAQMRYPNGDIQRTCSRVPTLGYLFANHTPLMLRKSWHARLNAHHWYEGWDRDSDQDVEVVPGSCTIMRREDIYLDDDLRLYFPEDDLAKRTKKPFRFLAAAHITHHEKAATQNWSATRNYYRDLFIYTRKHHGWLMMALLWLMSRPVYWGMWWKNRQRKQVTAAGS